MKSYAFYLFVLLTISSTSHAQSDHSGDRSSVVGMWKISSAASGMKQTQPPPTWLKLNADSTYIWGIDSTKSNPLDGVSRGRWHIGPQAEVVLVATTAAGDTYITYFDHQYALRYRMSGHGEGDKKVPDIMLETEIIIEHQP